MSTDPPTPRPAGAMPLAGGVVLLLVTGFVDVYTFLQHGHVFAQAMTGNLVLVGIGVVDPTLVPFWRPMTSFLLFVVGVAVVWVLTRSTRSRAPQWTTLTVEVVVLTVAGFLPDSFPDPVVAGAISLAAGLQIGAFDRIGPQRFTTVVVTTNSLHAVSATLQALRSRTASDVRTAVRLVAAIAAFVGGAVTGALVTDAVGGRAAWVAAALFVVAGLAYLLPPPGSQPARTRPVGSAGPLGG